MKPFDLDRAKSGEPIVTRDGRSVAEFHHFESLRDSDASPCFAVVGKIGYWFKEDGGYFASGHPSNHDLFMAHEIRLGFINLFVNDVGTIILSRVAYAGEDVAHHARTHALGADQNIIAQYPGVRYVKTIEVKVEL
jgi:hypothetical protein